jgi:uncharacterized protein affecting Mg2+/Co2+ transport
MSNITRIYSTIEKDVTIMVNSTFDSKASTDIVKRYAWSVAIRNHRDHPIALKSRLLKIRVGKERDLISRRTDFPPFLNPGEVYRFDTIVAIRSFRGSVRGVLTFMNKDEVLESIDFPLVFLRRD